MYDGDSHTEWVSKRGQGNHSWVKIQFNSVLRISQIEVQQTSSDFGLFKEIGLSFSNGQSQTLNLSAVKRRWHSVTFNPPVDTTNVQLSAIDYYEAEQLEWLDYWLRDVRFYGVQLSGEWKLLLGVIF